MKKGIDDFFKEYIFGFMLGDIKVAIENGLNFLAALGLMEYTEILGGLVTGNLRKKGNAKKNFIAFLSYMGQYYIDLDAEINLYEKVRCGLSHEYFIKGESTIWTHTSSSSYRGIIYEKEKGKVHFIIQKYYEDFEKAVKKYHNKVVNEKDRKLIELFEKALDSQILY